jgi:hypothetical protein
MVQHEAEGGPIDITEVMAACSKKQMLVTVPGYPDFSVAGASPPDFPPEMLAKSDELAAILGVTEKVKGWEWASQKTGKKVTNKLKKFADEKHEPRKLGPIELLLILTELVYAEPHMHGKPVRGVPLDLDDLEDQLDIRDSSAGIDPAGNPKGSCKRDHAAFAVSRFIHQMYCGPDHDPFVYCCQSKGNEYTPEEKDQRKIFCECTCHLVAHQICFSELLYRPRNVFAGTAQNLSLGQNTGVQYVMKLTPDLPWREEGRQKEAMDKARDILDKDDALSESDKSAWEYRVNPFLRVIPLAKLIYLTNWKDKELYLLPLIPALAGYIAPLVALHGSTAVLALLLNPSGSFYTLLINTDGHTCIAIDFKQSVQRKKIEPAYITPDDALMPEAALRRWKKSVIVHGDDFISRNVFANYDSYADDVWKTKTKTSTGTAASTRFLQRHLRWEGDVPQLVYDVERAKIKMCAPRPDMVTLAESIKSILLSTGSYELAAQVKPFVEGLGVRPLTVAEGKDNANTSSAFLNKGVLQRFWLPNQRLARDTGTSLALGEDFGIHPDYLDSLMK